MYRYVKTTPTLAEPEVSLLKLTPAPAEPEVGSIEKMGLPKLTPAPTEPEVGLMEQVFLDFHKSKRRGNVTVS